MQDFETIYLVVNDQQNRSYFPSDFPSIQMHGLLHAIDRKTGQLRWKQEIRNQNLIVDRLDHSPIVLLYARKYERKGNLHIWSLECQAVDKITGRLVLNTSIGTQSGFQEVLVNLPRHFVELRSYNERIRLTPDVQTTEAK